MAQRLPAWLRLEAQVGLDELQPQVLEPVDVSERRRGLHPSVSPRKDVAPCGSKAERDRHLPTTDVEAGQVII